MKASEFVAAYAGKGLATCEREALNQIAEGGLAQPPSLEVPVQIPPSAGQAGHTGSFFAVGDYLAIGEPGDYLRIPLTPRNAQRVADLFSVQLPTRKMVDAIYAAAPVKVELGGEVPNKGADLNQYLAHSRKMDDAIVREGGMLPGSLLAGGAPLGAGVRPVAGGMKDVVVAPNMPAGKVLIYGWHHKDGSHTQPFSYVHSAEYVDYSHGVRLISPNMIVDGRETTVAEVLADPVLSKLLSDQGPVVRPRYGKPPPSFGGEALSYGEMLARLRALG